MASDRELSAMYRRVDGVRIRWRADLHGLGIERDGAVLETAEGGCQIATLAELLTFDPRRLGSEYAHHETLAGFDALHARRVPSPWLCFDSDRRRSRGACLHADRALLLEGAGDQSGGLDFLGVPLTLARYLDALEVTRGIADWYDAPVELIAPESWEQEIPALAPLARLFDVAVSDFDGFTSD